jgi:hypothetical protein
MSAPNLRRSPDWGLRAAFAVNIAALLFAIYCVVVIVAFLYCFTLIGPTRCDPWSRHIPSSLHALACPVLALIGTASGARFARRGERKSAIRALLGWSALSVGAAFSFALVAPR